MSDDPSRPDETPAAGSADEASVVYGPPAPPPGSSPPSPHQWHERSGPAWVRFLYNHNPFYLLSTCFVLHGTARLLKPPILVGNDPPIDLWPMVALVGGYTTLMAVTAFLVVRFGKCGTTPARCS